DVTNLRPALIPGKDFTFYGWAKAQFVFHIFAAAPIHGSLPSSLGGSEKTLASDHLHLQTQEPARLSIVYYKGAAWGSFKSSRNTISLVSFNPLKELSPKHNDHVLHGVASV